MAEAREIKVPDIGDFEGVEVIDVLVKAGERVEKEDSLITLESDKAAMDVPAPFAGMLSEVKVKVGDRVSQGDVIALAEPADSKEHEKEPAAESRPAETPEDKKPPREQEERAAEPRLTKRGAPVAREREMAAEAGEATSAADDGQIEVDEAALTEAKAAADLSCEVLVLGSGPGGYTAAFRAADLGRKVVLVERYAALGGVCLNVGCIPSKALLHAAEVIEQARAMGEHGLEFGTPKIDVERLRGFKQKAVDRQTKGLAQLAKSRKVRVVTGSGRFVSKYVLEVADGDGARRKIAFERAIVAAGSEALRLPGQPDDPRIVDSTGALELADVPKKLFVVGGGIIGLEMAQVYAALGSAVTVVELTEGLMPGTDRDLVRVLHKRLDKEFEAIHVETRVTELKPQKNGIHVRCEGPGGEWGGIFDRVLVAIGRRPNGRSIGAEAAGVAVNDKGFVETDSQMRTSAGHIFAIGDIAGPPLLAHKASHEGKVAAEAVCGMKSHFDVRAIPSVAYTHPEVAWAGITETEAQSKGIELDKASFPWRANGRAATLGVDDGFTKLLFERDTGRIVGAGIVGPNAGELIAELVLAIEMGCDAEDIALSVHPHPTLSESVGMAAEMAAGTITDLYLPKRR